MSLQRRILWGTLTVAAVTLVAGVVGAAAIRKESRSEAQDELYRQAEVTAHLVQQQLSTVIAAETRPPVVRVARILEEARLIGGHDFLEAALVTSRGRTVDLVADPVLLPLIATGEIDRDVRTVTIGGKPVFATVRAISGSTADDAQVRILVAIGRYDTFVIGKVVTRTLLFTLIAGALAAVFLALGLSRSLGRKLRRLSGAAHAYAGGDFTARAPVEGHDEFAEVGEAFNEMASQLEDLRSHEREFLMSVGHDLRTPLTTIRGYAEGLDSGTFDASDLPRVAGVLHAQTGRLSRLVEDLMALARLQSSEFTLRNEPVDLAAHLGGVVAGYSLRAGEAEVALEPVFGDVGIVEVDPDRIGQVTGNLLDNALRYTPAHGRVRIELDRAGKGIRLRVSDTGPGIDPEDLAHVFDRFYVSQRYRAVRSEGSGLGLSIVKALVEQMGGSVSVASVPGEGTTVTVLIGG